jgi:WD40 repeat protein
MRSVGALALVLIVAFASAEEPLRRIGDDRFRFTGTASASALSADGRRLAVLSWSSIRRTAIVAIFDIASRRPLAVTRTAIAGEGIFPYPGLAFSPDGRRVAVAMNRDTAYAFDATTGRELWRDRQAKAGGREYCGFDSTGRLVRSTDRGYCLIDIANDTIAATWPVGEATIVSPDGKTFARLNEKRTAIDLGDPVTNRTRHVLPLKSESNADERGLAFSHDGRTLAIVHDLSEIHLIDVATGKTRRTWKLVEHTLPKLNAEYAIAFSQNDKSLVLSTTGEILSWDLEPFRERKSLMQGQSEFVRTWQLVDDGRTLLLPRNGLVERWITATGERIPEE